MCNHLRVQCASVGLIALIGCSAINVDALFQYEIEGVTRCEGSCPNDLSLSLELDYQKGIQRIIPESVTVTNGTFAARGATLYGYRKRDGERFDHLKNVLRIRLHSASCDSTYNYKVSELSMDEKLMVRHDFGELSCMAKK